MKKHALDTIRPVTPEDYPEISAWARARGISGLKPDVVPPQGFIAPGIACGFMARTNTGIALLDHFCSNPEATREGRDLVLARIAELLLAAGKATGVRVFYAITTSEKIRALCRKHGFRKEPDELWLKGNL